MSARITTLPNGLRVISETMEHVETASVGVWVEAGARFEAPEINGVTHLLEHMTFKGTETRSAQALVEEIEDVGGQINAYTTRETTAYYAKMLKEDLGLAVDVVADLVQNAVLDEDELKKERAVVVQEINQSFDTPDDIIYDHFQETVFPEQAVGRPVLGTEDRVMNMPRQAVMDYMTHHYTPANMVLAAAGNLNHDELVDLAQTHFQTAKETTPAPQDPARYIGGDFRHKRDLEQVHLLMGFEGVPYEDDEVYAASVLATLLGGGMSSRLFQEIREKRGLVYSIYAYGSSYTDAGLFGIYAGTSEKELAELVPVTCDEINKTLTGLSEDEVARARAQMKASTLMSLESTSSRAEQLARQLMVYGRPLEIAEVIAKIDAVDAAQAEAVARRIFSTTPTLAAIGPVGALENYDTFKGRFN